MCIGGDGVALVSAALVETRTGFGVIRGCGHPEMGAGGLKLESSGREAIAFHC